MKIRTDIPAVVVGCGPSAVQVPWAPDRYTVHAVNDAIRLCERADVLAINDTPVLRRMTVGDFRKASCLLLPEYLHDDPRPNRLTPYERALENALHDLPVAASDGIVVGDGGIEVATYLLHTDHRVQSGDEQPTFGRCRSTSDSLIAWLLLRGVRTFNTVGIEWDGADGWAEGLPRGAPKSREHRRSIWEYTVRRVEMASAQVRRGLP